MPNIYWRNTHLKILMVFLLEGSRITFDVRWGKAGMTGRVERPGPQSCIHCVASGNTRRDLRGLVNTALER